MATEKDFKVKNGLQVGNGLINATNGDVSLRRGMSTTNRIRITSGNIINDTNVIISGNLDVSGNFNITGDINQTSVTTLDVTDKTITVANNAGSAANANGAGIIVDTGTNNPQMIYTSATDEWDFNRSIDINGGSGTGVKIHSGGAIVGAKSGGDTQLMYWGGGPVYYGRSSLGGSVSGHEFRIGGVTKLNVDSNGDTVVSGNLKLGANDLLYTGGGNFDIKHTISSQNITLHTTTSGGATSEIVRVTHNKRVGINIQSPDAPLHVEDSPAGTSAYGGLRVVGAGTGSGSSNVRQIADFGRTSSGSDSGAWIGGRTDETTAIFGAKTASGNIAFEVYQSGWKERMRIKNDGKVGIGTSNPLAQLHIENTTSDGIIVRTTTNAEPYIALQRNSGSNGVAVLRGIDGGDLRIDTGATGAAQTTKMTIEAGGNVGINNTDPDQKLSVNGVISADFNQDYYGSWMSGNSASNGYSTVAVGEWYSSGLYMQKKTGQAFSHIYSYAPSYPIAIAAGSGAHGETALANGEGKVGVGTTAPTAKFHVVDNDSDDYIAIFKQTHASNLGTVNIDTPTDNNSRPSRLDFSRGGTLKWKTGMVYGDASNGWGLSDATASGTAIQQTRFLVKPGGNVGIGTTDPGHLLDILNAGSGDATIKVKSTTAGDPTLLFDSAAVNRNAVIKFLDQGSAVAGRIQYVHNGDRMDFQAGSSTGATMSILNGKVGIGTDNPFATSHVKYTSWSSGAPYGTVQLIEGNAVNDNNWGHLVITDTDTAVGQGGAISFATGAASSMNPFAGIKGVAEGSTFGGIGLFTRASGGTATQRMNIKANGDVKVGALAIGSATTAPLHVAKASTDVQAIFGDNNSSIDDPSIRIIGRNSANNAIRYTFLGLDADANHGYLGYNAGAGGFVNALSFNTDGIVTVEQHLQLAAINNTDSGTQTRRVFIYDTRKDSDGGAWRHRTQHTSWYNEAASATRSATKKFPQVAVIVSTSTKVLIHDGDDPDMPVWMEFSLPGHTVASNWASTSVGLGSPGFQAATPMSVHMLNGLLVIGCQAGGQLGGYLVNFISEWMCDMVHYGSATDQFYTKFANGIAERNDSTTRAVPQRYSNSDPNPKIAGRLNNGAVNDVDMCVLPDAPIDPSTGLPEPTIALATLQGVNIITDQGTVAYITAGAGSAYNGASYVRITDNYNLIFEQDSAGRAQFYIPLTESSRTSQTNDGSITDKVIMKWYESGGSHYFPYYKGAGIINGEAMKGDRHALIGDTGDLTLVDPHDVSNTDNYSAAYIGSDYTTGWMTGAGHLATLNGKTTGNLTTSDVLGGIGNFTDANAWSVPSGWSLSSNIATGSNVTAYLTPASNGILTTGAQYQVTITQSSWSSGFAYIYMGTGAPGGKNHYINLPQSTGTFTYTLTAYSTNFGIYGANYSGVLDNVTVKTLEPDRTPHEKGVLPHGTITRTAVETGAELVGYTGFSANNYLRHPGFTFGNEFVISFWMKTATNFGCAFHTAQGTRVEFAGGAARFTMYDGSYTVDLRDEVFPVSEWTKVDCIRDVDYGALYVNGRLVEEETRSNFGALNNDGGALTIGNRSDSASEPFDGVLSLFRISKKGRPTAAQILQYYEEEKHLFQENAYMTIGGTSNVVTALAYDHDTDLLHIGNSWGKSTFSGLRMVDYTSDVVGNDIDASGGMIVED